MIISNEYLYAYAWLWTTMDWTHEPRDPNPNIILYTFDSI